MVVQYWCDIGTGVLLADVLEVGCRWCKYYGYEGGGAQGCKLNMQGLHALAMGN